MHAYIVGEHGDSEVPLWSSASIGGLPLRDRTVLGRPFDRETMDALFDSARRAAYEIIARKGHTDLAIGTVLAHLVEVILGDQKSVLPVSVRLQGEYGLEGVCLSIPCVVGIDGVEGRVPLEVTPKSWRASAAPPPCFRQGWKG